MRRHPLRHRRAVADDALVPGDFGGSVSSTRCMPLHGVHDEEVEVKRPVSLRNDDASVDEQVAAQVHQDEVTLRLARGVLEGRLRHRGRVAEEKALVDAERAVDPG